MKLILSFFIVLILSCSKSSNEIIDTPSTPIQTFLKGMDLSFQAELESFNVSYKDENNASIVLLPFVKQKGTNIIRLKLWHTPQNGLNGLEAVKLYAQKIKQNGMQFLLDIHYSDTWADPGHQTPPLAWQNLSIEQVKDEIYTYTLQVMNALKNQGTVPDMVQIGNETDSGFLWNFGKVWNEFNNNWSNYALLFNKAAQAIRNVNGNQTRIILHHSSVENSIYFLNQLNSFNVDYDIIGLSYYPQFQTKDLSVVQNKLNTLASTFNKDIMLVEVAYPFTLNWSDNLGNYIGDANQIIPQFSATPTGQKDFLQKIIQILKDIPNQRGIGFVYWAPDWVSFSGNEASSTGGSAWENQCLWDFNHKALPALEVFSAH